MRLFRSVQRWRVMFGALCALASLLVLTELAFAGRAIFASHSGTLGMERQVVNHFGKLEWEITALVPGGPMQQAGARVGDRISFDRVYDAQRHYGVAETIGLKVERPRGALHRSEGRRVGKEC